MPGADPTPCRAHQHAAGAHPRPPENSGRKGGTPFRHRAGESPGTSRSPADSTPAAPDTRHGPAPRIPRPAAHAVPYTHVPPYRMRTTGTVPCACHQRRTRACPAPCRARARRRRMRACRRCRVRAPVPCCARTHRCRVRAAGAACVPPYRAMRAPTVPYVCVPPAPCAHPPGSVWVLPCRWRCVRAAGAVPCAHPPGSVWVLPCRAAGAVCVLPVPYACHRAVPCACCRCCVRAAGGVPVVCCAGGGVWCGVVSQAARSCRAGPAVCARVR